MKLQLKPSLACICLIGVIGCSPPQAVSSKTSRSTPADKLVGKWRVDEKFVKELVIKATERNGGRVSSAAERMLEEQIRRSDLILDFYEDRTFRSSTQIGTPGNRKRNREEGTWEVIDATESGLTVRMINKKNAIIQHDVHFIRNDLMEMSGLTAALQFDADEVMMRFVRIE